MCAEVYLLKKNDLRRTGRGSVSTMTPHPASKLGNYSHGQLRKQHVYIISEYTWLRRKRLLRDCVCIRGTSVWKIFLPGTLFSAFSWSHHRQLPRFSAMTPVFLSVGSQVSMSRSKHCHISSSCILSCFQETFNFIANWLPFSETIFKVNLGLLASFDLAFQFFCLSYKMFLSFLAVVATFLPSCSSFTPRQPMSFQTTCFPFSCASDATVLVNFGRLRSSSCPKRLASNLRDQK